MSCEAGRRRADRHHSVPAGGRSGAYQASLSHSKINLVEVHRSALWLNFHTEITVPHLIELRQLVVHIDPEVGVRHSPLLGCHPEDKSWRTCMLT